MQEKIEEILGYWFGNLPDDKTFPTDKAAMWFQDGPKYDSEIKERFKVDLDRATRGSYDDWTQGARGTLALIILLDQFSRNIFRGTPEAFEQDRKALKIAYDQIKREQDRELKIVERYFFYMPFMHSENIEFQERSVALFGLLAKAAPAALEVPMLNAFDYAKQHRDIVKCYGRFPHRNKILGRESTPQESEFLTQPGSSF